MENNDVYARPATKSIILKDCTRYSYGSGKSSNPKNTPRSVYRATIL